MKGEFTGSELGTRCEQFGRIKDVLREKIAEIEVRGAEGKSEPYENVVFDHILFSIDWAV